MSTRMLLAPALLLLACASSQPPPPEPSDTLAASDAGEGGPTRAQLVPAKLDHVLARERVRAFDGEDALDLFTRLLRRDHGDTLAGIGLAQTGVEFGIEPQAEAALQRVLEGDKIHAVGARVGLAMLSFARYEVDGDPQRFTDAEHQLQNVLAVEPDNSAALALAVLLYLQRAQQQGDAQAPQARAVCQAHEGAHAMLAASCAEEAWRRGDPGTARELFARATREDVEQHGAWLRWGALELEAGNIRSARRCFELATMSPWPSLRLAAHAALGVTLDRIGDAQAALSSYREAAQLCERLGRPLPAELLLNLGVAAGRLANDDVQLDEARALLERWLAQSEPSDPQRLRVQRALTELESIRAEHQRMH